MPSKSISKHVIFKFFLGTCPQTPIALACFVQHNKHNDFLNQTLAGYVPDSTENKFGPLTIKHLPTPMIGFLCLTK